MNIFVSVIISRNCLPAAAHAALLTRRPLRGHVNFDLTPPHGCRGCTRFSDLVYPWKFFCMDVFFEIARGCNSFSGVESDLGVYNSKIGFPITYETEERKYDTCPPLECGHICETETHRNIMHDRSTKKCRTREIALFTRHEPRRHTSTPPRPRPSPTPRPSPCPVSLAAAP
jgi:hypothetical protein